MASVPSQPTFMIRAIPSIVSSDTVDQKTGVAPAYALLEHLIPPLPLKLFAT